MICLIFSFVAVIGSFGLAFCPSGISSHPDPGCICSVGLWFRVRYTHDHGRNGDGEVCSAYLRYQSGQSLGRQGCFPFVCRACHRYSRIVSPLDHLNGFNWISPFDYAGFIKVILYMMFMLIMIRVYTLPLFAVRPMYLAMRFVPYRSCQGGWSQLIILSRRCSIPGLSRRRWVTLSSLAVLSGTWIRFTRTLRLRIWPTQILSASSAEKKWWQVMSHSLSCTSLFTY